MDGDGASGVDGEIGGLSPAGTRDVVQTEGDSEDDSASGTLQSMGYVDSEAEVGRDDGDATGSGDSILQTVAIVAVAGFFALTAAYFLLEMILWIVGAAL
ncbi:hypothetical protein [Halosimplex sp. TS25]|uniref:hypothetical protein n=1 Tax=Halosimplex rarum TaxID=3396619 RepID=UPI0039EA40D6